MPSAQRGLRGAHRDRLDELGELVVDVDVRRSVVMSIAYIVGFLSDEWEGGGKAKGRRDLAIPTASERMLPTCCVYVGCLRGVGLGAW